MMRVDLNKKQLSYLEDVQYYPPKNLKKKESLIKKASVIKNRIKDKVKEKISMNYKDIFSENLLVISLYCKRYFKVCKNRFIKFLKKY